MGHRTLTFSVAALQRLAGSILEAVGTPPDLAGVVAASLVTANLTGHDSHGVMRLMSYVSFVRAGRVKPAQRPVLRARHHATAAIDGGWGWGQPAARLATETAIALAAAYGIGAVTVRECNHIGRLGEYVESMTRAGMMGLALCNAGPVVAPLRAPMSLKRTPRNSTAPPGRDQLPAAFLQRKLLSGVRRSR